MLVADLHQFMSLTLGGFLLDLFVEGAGPGSVVGDGLTVEGAADVGRFEEVDDTEGEETGFALIDDFDGVSKVVLPRKHDVLSKVKRLIFDNPVIIFHHLHLRRFALADFAGHRVHPIFVAVGVEKERHFLGNWQGQRKICALALVKFEHVLVELVSKETAAAVIELPRIELILSFPELHLFLMVNFLCHC